MMQFVDVLETLPKAVGLPVFMTIRECCPPAVNTMPGRRFHVVAASSMVSTCFMSARCNGRSWRGLLRLLLITQCVVWSHHTVPLRLLYHAHIYAALTVQIDAIKQKNEV